MWLIALLYLICASTFTISKAALTYVQPLFFTGSRMVAAGIILLLYHRWRGNKIIIPQHHYLLFGQIILFYIYFAYVFDILALKHLTSARACLLYDLSPFISALFSYLWFHEMMTSKKWIGLGIGLCAFLPSFLSTSAQGVLRIGWGDIIMLGAIVSSAYGWILVRQLVKENNYPSTLINGVGMLGGGLLAFITSFFVEGWNIAPWNNFGAFVYYTAMIVVVANFAFSNLYTVLLKKYTATLLSFAGFTAPLFAAGLGWLFLGEAVSWDFFVTTACVLLGLYIFYQEELKQGYVAE